jgi:hypothetical protein
MRSSDLAPPFGTKLNACLFALIGEERNEVRLSAGPIGHRSLEGGQPIRAAEHDRKRAIYGIACAIAALRATRHRSGRGSLIHRSRPIASIRPRTAPYFKRIGSLSGQNVPIDGRARPPTSKMEAADGIR